MLEWSGLPGPRRSLFPVAYLSLYRKYRSQTFGDLMGQEHVVRTLQNGITSGRIAHAYLFTGPRGTGKTSSARLLAKALCCENGPTAEPCNECHICTSITVGNCLDVMELDAASESSVENVRETIVEVANYRPAVARYRVFIIDEVHDLSAKAFDALLKTIEEPPPHLIFVLATTEFNKVPPTIRSRCQKFEFHRGSVQDILSRLQHVAQAEQVEYEPAALAAIARMSDGGYRDALTLLEQAILTANGAITTEQVYAQLGLVNEETVDELLGHLKGRDVAQVMRLLGEILRRGRDPRSILESLMHRLGDLTHAAFGVDEALDVTQAAAMREMALRIGPDELLRLRSGIAEAHGHIRDVTLPRLWLEAELVRLCSPVVPVAAPPAVAREEVRPPRPVERPAEPAVRSTPQTAPVPAEEPGTPVNNELKRARQAWASVVKELSELSKLMKPRLAATKVGNFEDGTIRVLFARKLDLDWILDSPKREAAIRDSIRKYAGEPWVVKLEVGERSAPAPVDDPVECVLEGDQLREAAKEVFQQPPPEASDGQQP